MIIERGPYKQYFAELIQLFCKSSKVNDSYYVDISMKQQRRQNEKMASKVQAYQAEIKFKWAEVKQN